MAGWRSSVNAPFEPKVTNVGTRITVDGYGSYH